MNPDPWDLIGGGRNPTSCVNGLCNKPAKCRHHGYCLDQIPGCVIPAVPCKFCGIPTPMLNTKLCDNCWEINRRISHWSLRQHVSFWWRSKR